ncbi:Uncharacterized protein Rs2_28284 [Raphanus sativus]|nr:Uncharacterized protein Rs2_28284 [Raphanus sativus]
MVNKSRCYRNFTLAGVHEPTIDPSTANLQSQSHPRRHPAAPNAGIEKKPNSQIILRQARSRLTVAHDSRFPRTNRHLQDGLVDHRKPPTARAQRENPSPDR